MWPNPQFPADLVIFAEEIPNGKLHFLCSGSVLQKLWIVRWVECVRLKLTFSHGRLYANFGKFIFLVRTTVKFRNLQISKNSEHPYKQNFSNS